MSETEVESSKTFVMPAMMTSSTTLEEEMTNMKAILEKLTRESKEDEERIKLQEEKIAKLSRKLKKTANSIFYQGLRKGVHPHWGFWQREATKERLHA